MTTNATERLRDAIETYVRDSTSEPHRLVTDYIVCAVSIDLHTANEAATYTTIATSAPHVSLGLHTILGEHLIGDDDE